jgi:hypothetical protein
MSAIATGHAAPAAAPSNTALRWTPLSGIASAVFFIGGVLASSPPETNASNAKWIANYTASHNAGHIASGVFLALSGLTFMLFIVGLWQRISAVEASTGKMPSPLPMVAAGVTAACMSVGGVLMAAPSAVVSGGGPVPNADLLRFCNSTGFGVVGVSGMLAAAVAVIAVSVQGRRANLFGQKLYVFGIVVAVILLAAVEFLPILILLIWLVVVAVVQIKQSRGPQMA